MLGAGIILWRRLNPHQIPLKQKKFVFNEEEELKEIEGLENLN